MLTTHSAEGTQRYALELFNHVCYPTSIDNIRAYQLPIEALYCGYILHLLWIGLCVGVYLYATADYSAVQMTFLTRVFCTALIADFVLFQPIKVIFFAITCCML